MRALTLLALVAALLASVPGFAISRVGTCGVGDQKLGFEIAQVPAPYRDVRNVASGNGVKLNGPPIFGGGPFGRGLVENSILVYSFSDEYPEMASLGRQAIKDTLDSEGRHWEEHSVWDPCILILTTTNGDLRTTIAAWGEAKGLVVQSPLRDSTDRVVEEFLASIQLSPGACSWR